MQRGRELSSAWVGYPTRPFVGVTLAGVVRYVVFGALLVASLMFYVWSRVDVRARAADLETAREHLSELRTDQDRLSLELAARRDLAALDAVGARLGLVSEVDVVAVNRP